MSLRRKDVSVKKPMQNVRFKSIDEMLDFLPADELKITDALRRIVLECIPDVKEKLSFNFPFYKRKTTICFIWPGSVSWGSVTQKGVRFGFQNGHLLNDQSNYLEKGERKQVFWRDYHHVNEIDVPLLKSYIYEAVIIDNERPKKKLSRRSGKSK